MLYLEASSQARDVQNERILASALMESKDYFLRYGRIDLDHATVWKMIRETKLDPQNPYLREIGRPLEVRISDKGGDPRLFVKCAIYRAKPGASNQFTPAADWFWDTLQCDPPVVWYPSVSGALLGAHFEPGPGGTRNRVINKMRWHSIALTRTPVNTDLGAASTVPLEVFAKALREGEDLSSALAALAGHGGAPTISDPDVALRAAGIQVPDATGGSVPAGLTLEKVRVIEESIREVQDTSDLGGWLRSLLLHGVSPQEGMAYLLALLEDSFRALPV